MIRFIEWVHRNDESIWCSAFQCLCQKMFGLLGLDANLFELLCLEIFFLGTVSYVDQTFHVVLPVAP